MGAGRILVVYSRSDSDLEAFSHYPADGSVAPLSDRARAEPEIRSNGSSRTRLHFCSNH